MLQVFRATALAPSDVDTSINDLLQATSRRTILLSGAMYLSWHILTTGGWIAVRAGPVWLVTLVMVLTYSGALWLLPRRLVAAQIVWLVGLTMATTVALVLFRQPEIAFLYALLPFLAVVTLHWRAGLLAEGLIILLLVWLAQDSSLHLSSVYLLAIACGGLITGLFGWASCSTLMTVAEWSFSSFTQARHYMEEAQKHRAQLATMLKDLDQAYYRLERSNAALVAARKVAEDAEHFKTEFITHVSHEIRTPLNLIIGFSDVMLTAPESYDGLVLPGPYRSDLMAIKRSAHHLLDLTEDILNLARIEIGKTTLICEEIALIELVSEATDAVRDFIAAKGVALTVHIAADLPTLLLDRLRIRQVLLNLLVNAARFTEHGSITVEAERRDDEVMVRVSDTGRGIPPDELAKVFETFHTTVAPTMAWRSGVGLGLPISKQYVQLHHGQIGVESVEGRGTAFWFTLPCGHVPSPDPDHQATRPW